MTARPEYWFYHLERTRLEAALPPLLEKSLQKGWRALVRSRDPARLEMLDDHLWTWRDDAFLPHGRDGDADAARQPIVLTAGDANLNHAQAAFLLDGAEAPDEDGVERCVVLFDADDPDAVTSARARWKSLKDAGAPVSYWKQGERGRWEKVQ